LAFIVPAAGRAEATPPAARPFFAFDNGMGRGRLSFDQQAEMLKNIGYDGIAFSGAAHVPEMLKALDVRGLKMLSIYVDANVDPGKPPYDRGLKTAIEQLKGRGTQIWLPISGGKPSSDASDDRAVAILREVADMAEQSGLPVAIYPHVGCYAQRVEDALRLVKKADRKNLGICFNLCHFFRLENERDLEQRLAQSAPHLLSVNINGVDGGAAAKRDWKRLIQTLDRGSFDVGGVLRTLKRLHYTGPVGLQCFDVPGDPRENLTRSMAAWRKLTANVSAGQ
jgi:sugar phosphate isomerase/epimerase